MLKTLDYSVYYLYWQYTNLFIFWISNAQKVFLKSINYSKNQN